MSVPFVLPKDIPIPGKSKTQRPDTPAFFANAAVADGGRFSQPDAAGIPAADLNFKGPRPETVAGGILLPDGVLPRTRGIPRCKFKGRLEASAGNLR